MKCFTEKGKGSIIGAMIRNRGETAVKGEKQAATMSDVAREAGVALGTVSKVINGIPVGESYRLKVEQAVKKLNYQVNPSAKALKSKRTSTIALIIPNTIAPFNR